jgi:hypothetical protein
MKNLLFAFLLVPFVGSAHNANLGGITEAISKGDATELSKYFDQSVEIALLDEEDVYNKAQAESIIKDFFGKNKPTSFSQVHQGTSKGQDSKYCIGNLTTSTATFRVYIYMKVVGENYTIQELRFDKE